VSKNKKEHWYPEHQKLAQVKDTSQKLGEFLEWLDSQGLYICEAGDRGDAYAYLRSTLNIEGILAKYFEIDRKKIDDEKDWMLWHQRKLNEISQMDAVKARVRWHELAKAWSDAEFVFNATVPSDHPPEVYAREKRLHREREREMDLLCDRFPSISEEQVDPN
jgi:hypothetical protein